MINLTVSKIPDGTNCFSTLSAAIAHLPKDSTEPAVIFLKSGIYHEKIAIERPFVSIIGENAASTIITFNDHATQKMPDGSKRGTFRSYTMFLNNHDITLSHLTIRNESSPRSLVGQAIALYADGDRIFLEDCRLESYQDTLFTGPLPPSPLSPGGFIGPKEFDERIVGRQYYKDCYICGDVDFIFGSATAYFDHCEIASVYSEELPWKDGAVSPVYGYVTASSTPEGYPFGYVFHECRFTSTCPDRSVYLGRPWRNFAKTVLIDCQLGSHIREEGFHDWNKKEAHHTVLYGEYHSTGEGASPEKRAPFVRQLTDSEALGYTRESVLSGNDHWNP